jgi:hypothetical protein
VLRAGFAWYEELGGICLDGARRARRVIGFGSVTSWESWATARLAAWQARRPPTDTRLAVRPADMDRPFSELALARVLRRLLDGRTPLGYGRFLGLSR